MHSFATPSLIGGLCGRARGKALEPPPTLRKISVSVGCDVRQALEKLERGKEGKWRPFVVHDIVLL